MKCFRMLSLLWLLQRLWDEVGETDGQCETTLLEIEQECLKVYMKKIEEAKECRTKLQREIATAMAELSDIFTSMGENSVQVLMLLAYNKYIVNC